MTIAVDGSERLQAKITSLSCLAPVAPDALRARVAGNADADWYSQSGARTVLEWQTALAAVGRELESFGCILDFGCGCGRTLRYIKPLLQGRQRLIGVDPDKEAIEWVTRNYSGITALATSELPPLPLERASVDLILNHSVFTHLPEDIQHLWLFELARILRIGGYAVLSFHGEKPFADYRRGLEKGGDVSAAIRCSEQLKDNGHLFINIKSAAEAALPSYYGAAFHTIGYIQRNWCQSFRLRAWLPTFALDYQDVVVLEKL